MRVSFLSEEHVGLEELRRDMAAEAARFAMDYVFHDEAEKMKVVIMVSRFGHC